MTFRFATLITLQRELTPCGELSDKTGFAGYWGLRQGLTRLGVLHGRNITYINYVGVGTPFVDSPAAWTLLGGLAVRVLI